MPRKTEKKVSLILLPQITASIKPYVIQYVIYSIISSFFKKKITSKKQKSDSLCWFIQFGIAVTNMPWKKGFPYFVSLFLNFLHNIKIFIFQDFLQQQCFKRNECLNRIRWFYNLIVNRLWMMMFCSIYRWLCFRMLQLTFWTLMLKQSDLVPHIRQLSHIKYRVIFKSHANSYISTFITVS